MSVINVTNTSGLIQALQSAHAGDTIELASGTYSSFTLSGINIAGNVTITSQNSLNPAVLTGFYLSSSSGLTFSNLDFSVAQSVDAKPFRLLNSQNVTFTNLNISGAATDEARTVTGLYIQGSTNVAVTDSQFHSMMNGMEEVTSNNVTISGNSFHDLGSDGVDNSGSSNVTISGNVFTDFSQQPGTHPDAIQFFTSGTTTEAQNITVTDNLIYRGAGDVIQGVFIQDETGVLPYQNVTVTNNDVIGELYNGIAVRGANDVTISGNTVDAYSDMTSWIRVDNSTSVSLTNNTSASLQMTNDSGVIQSGQTTLAYASDLGASVISQWLASHAAGNLTGASQTLSPPNPVSVTSSVSIKMPSTSLHLTLTGTGDIDAIANGMNGATITGNTGDNTITAGSSNDTLTGGGGNDTFVMPMYCGSDTITDFGANGAHDVLDLSAHLAQHDPITITSSGANTVISFASCGSITLLGVQPSQLTQTSIGYSIH